MESIDHIAIVVTNINHAVNWYKDNRDCEVSYQDGTKHRDGSESIYEHDTFGNIIERIKYEKPKS